MIYYWLLVAVGIAASYFLSSIVHLMLDMPRGVPLARLGLAGAAAQISLTIFPLIFAPILLGFAFWGREGRKPKKLEYRSILAAVAISALGVWFGLFFVSGIWFGVIQGGIWFALLFLVVPPAIAVASLFVLFGSVRKSYASSTFLV